MNEIITNNLFEFWDLIAQKNNIYTQTPHYKSVYPNGSDWPKRIYAIEDKKENYEEIIKLSNQNILPNIITLNKSTDLLDFKNVQLLFSQLNMSLDMSNYTAKNDINNNIYQVETMSDAVEFANIASESFGYKVDGSIVYRLCQGDINCKLFIYREEKEGYGCGIIFFDKNNIAGLHMIGTVAKGRGKGIAKSMVEKLLNEAYYNNSKYCVLNASKMGESIYKQLGFEGFGMLENYMVSKF